MTIRFKVKNLGDTLWLSVPINAPGTVSLGCHILDEKEKIELGRGHLAKDIHPEDEEIIKFNFTAPNKKGKYVLEFDMVNEHICWFNDRGSEPFEINLEII